MKLADADINRMRERSDAIAVNRYCDIGDTFGDYRTGPSAVNCDEPAECTCPRGVAFCQRVTEAVVLEQAA